VCYILDAFAPQIGGVETEFRETTSRLAQRGFDVTVLAPTACGATGAATVQGVPVHYYPWPVAFGHPLPRRGDLDPWVAHADLVHTTTYSAAPAALRAARRHGKPCILSVQECLGRKWSWVESRRLRAAAFFAFERYVVTRGFSALHAISEATKRDLVAAGLPAGVVTTVRLGIDHTMWNEDVAPRDLTALLGFDPGARVFLFTGRPGLTKGADILLEAVRLCRPRLPGDVRFGFIMSDRPPGARDRFVQSVRRMQLEGLVSVRPSLAFAELPGYVRAAYCAVVPSVTEGFGLCAAEACAAGTPLIASDGGSLPEVVSGRHLLFRNRSPADLAERILDACHGRFDETPRRVFDWDVTADSIAELYVEVLRAGAARP
jgi:glycosyltransferase involved in cell wall biosynthesis